MTGSLHLNFISKSALWKAACYMLWMSSWNFKWWKKRFTGFVDKLLHGCTLIINTAKLFYICIMIYTGTWTCLVWQETFSETVYEVLIGYVRRWWLLLGGQWTIGDKRWEVLRHRLQQTAEFMYPHWKENMLVSSSVETFMTSLCVMALELLEIPI